MTNEQKLEMYKMRLEGASLQECADVFGVTREYVRQLTPPVETHAKRRSNYDSCIYPAIAEWLYENRYSYHAFAKLCATSIQPMYRALTGVTPLSKKLIDAILDSTGLTYEDAFKK